MSDLTKAQEMVDRLFESASHPLCDDEHEDLRLGIFIDRAEGRCAAMILSTTNNRYAFLTKGEHVIEDTDDYDSVMEAVNAACEDIQRWANAPDEEIG